MSGFRTNRQIVANQVFIGYPWRTSKKKYDNSIKELQKTYPLCFVVIGRDGQQDAIDLFSKIKRKIKSSSYAIFDATGGNANVSLEYGIAEAWSIPRVIYLCTHRARKNPSIQDLPIIADLAGKNRNHYKMENDLKKLLADFCKKHRYTIRFERFLKFYNQGKSGGAKRRSRALALKVIKYLSARARSTERSIITHLSQDQVGYKAVETRNIIRGMIVKRLLMENKSDRKVFIFRSNMLSTT